MGKKTVRLNTDMINSLPNDKPVVYKVRNKQGENIYTGIAGKGNVHDRLKQHLPGQRDAIPAANKVQIEQLSSIHDAEKKEASIISRSKPKYNQLGKRNRGRR
jgi:excinuclease UvrABC nuclease subunit